VYQVAAVCLKGGGVVVFCPCWSKVLREVVTLGGYRMPLFYLLGGLAKVWREVVPLGLLSYSIGGLCVAGRCGGVFSLYLYVFIEGGGVA
jgi:hypothetical protein